mmetsp:Transcript_632/g.1552  ORF Transcript_632/g.1552 Transcript_632/m.1552 type:complete len:398 (+) Transcript_632:1499-2692(+)
MPAVHILDIELFLQGRHHSSQVGLDALASGAGRRGGKLGVGADIRQPPREVAGGHVELQHCHPQRPSCQPRPELDTARARRCWVDDALIKPDECRLADAQRPPETVVEPRHHKVPHLLEPWLDFVGVLRQAGDFLERLRDAPLPALGILLILHEHQGLGGRRHGAAALCGRQIRRLLLQRLALRVNHLLHLLSLVAKHAPLLLVHFGLLPAIVNDEQTRSDAPFPQRLEPLPDALCGDLAVERIPCAPSKHVHGWRDLLLGQRLAPARQRRGSRDGLVHEAVQIPGGLDQQGAWNTRSADSVRVALHAQPQGVRVRAGVRSGSESSSEAALGDERKDHGIRTALSDLDQQELGFGRDVRCCAAEFRCHPPKLASSGTQEPVAIELGDGDVYLRGALR